MSLRPHILRLLLVAASYFAADLLLNKLALGDGWEIFWPLNGISVALLILRPRREWPLLVLAIEIGTGCGEFLDGNSFVETLGWRALSALEILLSASLLPAFTRFDDWIRQPNLYFRFVAAIIAGPLLSGVLFSWYSGSGTFQSYLEAFSWWGVADAMGIAVTFPLTLGVVGGGLRQLLTGRQAWKTALALIPALALMSAVFSVSQYPLIFVLYPLLMAVDWILGFAGSALVLFCACVMSVYLTEHGYGPFADARGLGVSREVAVQVYLGFHLIGFLPISILFHERRRIDHDLRTALAHAAQLASVDSLTGVANRRTLDQRLDERWRQAARDQTPVALLMIDVDHFKQYNDHFGHRSGDICLRIIASTICAQLLRPSDMAARFGGEEFAVLIPETDTAGALHVAERIRHSVFNLSLNHPDGQDSRVTVSIGCASLLPSQDEGCHVLIEAADQMLYAAKGAGRNRVCVHEVDLAAFLERPRRA